MKIQSEATELKPDPGANERHMPARRSTVAEGPQTAPGGGGCSAAQPRPLLNKAQRCNAILQLQPFCHVVE